MGRARRRPRTCPCGHLVVVLLPVWEPGLQPPPPPNAHKHVCPAVLHFFH